MKACRNCGDSTKRMQPYCAACEFMTRQEAAVALHVSLPTFDRMVIAGKLHPRRINVRKMLIKRAEVDAILV